ncbi:hypothetical protein B0H65DRAFT_548376 [Neurospora tetraspora]|uniref:Uncharacterized protein n=1 Tax=Neurospora tetraspora TaxID=94610 RepID=A0AAE0JEL0_9PEZI|nr:hypothetical protein B0H65DRAFT_548376 [Neurospora tetraspora]
MSNEAADRWRDKPAGDIAGELRRLTNTLTNWGEHQLAADMRKILGEVEEFDPKEPINVFSLALSAEFLIHEVARLSRDFTRGFTHDSGEFAAVVKSAAFKKAADVPNPKQKKKDPLLLTEVQKRHREERLEAHQRAGTDNPELAATEDVDWSYCHLGDTEHQLPYILEELQGLKEWKDRDFSIDKPPTPILDRLHFLLEDSDTTITLEELTAFNFP